MLKVKIIVLVVASIFLLATNGCPLYPAPVAKTGQTTSYATGDDGEYQKGVAWPDLRFIDNEDGTVTDNLTGLIWLKGCFPFDDVDWPTALDLINGLNAGNFENYGYIDWRLPNIRELHSLIDYSNTYPALPQDHPFTCVMSRYWSSTTYAVSSDHAMYVDTNGGVFFGSKTGSNYINV